MLNHCQMPLTPWGHKMKKFDICKYRETVFDKQCKEVIGAVQGLSIEQKLAVLEQCLEYLRMAQAEGANNASQSR